MDSQESLWTERYINMQTGWDTGSITTPQKTYFERTFYFAGKAG